MSLIISVVTPQKLFQVSDTRLTKNGIPFDDFSVKTTVVSCLNGSMIISYTGIAFIGNVRTDEWLVQLFTDFQSWNKELKTTLKHLEISATKEFVANRLKLPLSFAVIGWEINMNEYKPFITSISNFEDEKLNSLEMPKEKFETRTLSIKKNAKLNKSFAILIQGAEPATTESYFNKAIRRFIKIGLYKDDTEIIDELVRLIRLAASHKTYGKYINKYCVSSYLELGSYNVLANYHNNDNQQVAYMPNLVSNGMSFKGIEIETI